MTIKEKEIKDNEIHTPIRQNFPKRKIISLGTNDLWPADLVIMSNYGDQNHNYKFMLNAIDTFSKYVWLQPLKIFKNGPDVSKAFEIIIQDALKIGYTSLNLLRT